MPCFTTAFVTAKTVPFLAAPSDDTQYGLQAVSKMVKAHIEKVGTDLVKSQVGKSSGGDEFVNQLIGAVLEPGGGTHPRSHSDRIELTPPGCVSQPCTPSTRPW